MLAGPFLARAIQNEFCGVAFSNQEPVSPCAPLHPGRWVYEKGAVRAACSGCAVQSGSDALRRLRCCSIALPLVVGIFGCDGSFLLICVLASPFLARAIQIEFCGVAFSTQEPAGPCATLHPGRWVYEKEEPKLLWGGCQVQLGTAPRQPSRVAVGPISYFAAFAWCPTVCRGTDDCGEHHLSTIAGTALAPGQRGIWEDSVGAREYPMCAEGWALWALGGSPDLYKATGGTYRLGKPQGRTSRAGLLLGRLGGVFGARKLPVLTRRRRSGEFRRGKQMRPAARLAQAGRAAGPRGP